jgi:N-methylhydantoinase A
MDRFELAAGVVELAHFNMMQAVNLVSVQKGYDPRDFVLVAFGGAGPVHASSLALQLGIRKVVIPPMAGVFSALGCLVSEVRHELVQTCRTALDEDSADVIYSVIANLAERGLHELTTDGHRVESVDLRASLDLRYVGQNSELDLDIDIASGGLDLAVITEAFHRLHMRSFDYRAEQPIECVNARVALVVNQSQRVPLKHHKEPGKATAGNRPAHLRSRGWTPVPILLRRRLQVDDELVGPVRIEEPSTTIVVLPGQRARVHPTGALIIETGA